MGGRRSQRRAARRAAREAAPEAPSRPPRRRRGGLRATIDSFGGFVTLGAVGLALLVVVVLVALNRPGSGGESGGEYVLRERSAPVAGFVLGNPDAPVRVIAFEDFSCGHCGDFARDTEPLIESEYVEDGFVAIEFRDMAILGPDSERAAAAAGCAADQELFWPYHDVLFLRQGTAGWASTGNLKEFAREVDGALRAASREGFDLEAFDACVDGDAHAANVDASTSGARELFTRLTGGASTPSFLIDGKPVVGAQGIEAFRQAIDAALPASDGDGG